MEADAADGEESDCYSRVMGASLVARPVKNPPPMQETWARSLGWEDPLKEETATHSSILPGKSHGQRSLADYMKLQRVGHD